MTMRIAYSGSDQDIEDLGIKIRDFIRTQIGKTDRSVGEMLRWFIGQIGGKVVPASEPAACEEEGGSLVVKNSGEFEVKLSPYTYYLRDNFTIAHELGHYFLHYDHSKPHEGPAVAFARYGSGRDEKQANRFAAALLMPAQEFRRKREEFGGNLTVLAAYFEVSKPAVRVRNSYI